MRIRTTKTKLYSFAELPESAREAAIENLRDINVDGEWWYECIFEDATTIGVLMGIDIKNIFFSGFSSQGDGACFEGSYEYKKGSINAIKEYAPQDAELHQIAQELQKTQQKNFYKLSASIKHSGHYYHDKCTSIDINHEDYVWSLPKEEDEESLKDALRSFMQWIYSQLNKQYEYSTSEEAIIETIEANEYEFTEDGKIS